MKRTIKTLFITAFLGVLSIVCHANDELDSEISRYLSAFKSNSFVEMKVAIDEMRWKGITDKSIYEAMLMQFNKSKLSTDRVAINQTAYFIRGFSFSGDEDYKKLLEKELAKGPHRKLVRHYEEAIENIDNYAKWNPVIAANLEDANNVHVQRIKNMLTSDYMEMISAAAKDITAIYYNDKELIDLTARRLVDIYEKADDDASVETAILLCKAVSKSGMSQYKELLAAVAEKAENKKLRKTAAKYLKKMQ